MTLERIRELLALSQDYKDDAAVYPENGFGWSEGTNHCFTHGELKQLLKGAEHIMASWSQHQAVEALTRQPMQQSVSRPASPSAPHASTE